ncbi:TonB-dependent receptor plug domain-containing protein [Sphingobacterium sp. Mn56C]|uniref:TonB-dependent receptor plug domain-containing protein n=1 Tax=Sphingobacterium sp. Mn56C TaxID=3395261 RepID=UPI003BD2A272
MHSKLYRFSIILMSLFFQFYGYTAEKYQAQKLCIKNYSYADMHFTTIHRVMPDSIDTKNVKPTRTLKEIIIERTHRSVAQKIRESRYAPEVIDFSDIKSSSKTVVEALNTLPGIRIQQQGGMGTSLNINLNGIDGKDVRVFVDEIPVYLLGRGFELQNLSLNLIDRIEIYKGLVPIQFGADALGGVINIVTAQAGKDFISLGYMYGSWNSQEASINSFGHPFKNKKLGVGMDAIYRHADNNYWMDDVDIVTDSLYNTAKGRGRRFNDAYDFALSRLRLEIKDRNWADNFYVIASFTHTFKAWQHGLMAVKPWGEPFSTEYTAGAAVNWQKSSKHTKNWQLGITTGYNYEQTAFVDTSSRVYFWDSNFLNTNKKGESGYFNDGRTPIIRQRIFYSRENASFKLGKYCTLNINALTTKRDLKGEDKAGISTYEKDPLRIPQTLLNNFMGVAVESNIWNKRLLSTTAVKHYYSRLRGAHFLINGVFDKLHTASSAELGFGQVFKWMVSPNFAFIPGYEYAIRQPDNREFFGDYILIKPNPDLKSANSHNINLKLQYSACKGRLFAGLNGIYRNTKNRILLTSIASSIAAYTNLLKTKTLGAEGFITYKPNARLGLHFNATYIDTRLVGVDKFKLFTHKYIGAQIPNTPYLYGNTQVAYTLFPNKRRYYFKFLYSLSYVHSYFLTWPMNGKKSSKANIPTQFLNDISLSIQTKNDRWSFAIDCKNILNARLFDNYSVQKPGRSFYGKLRYQFTNQTIKK